MNILLNVVTYIFYAFVFAGSAAGLISGQGPLTGWGIYSVVLNALLMVLIVLIVAKDFISARTRGE